MVREFAFIELDIRVPLTCCALTFGWFILHCMVVVINKRTSKRRFDQILARMNARMRKKQDDALMRLCGRAPLHEDPVEFQRAFRDEE